MRKFWDELLPTRDLIRWDPEQRQQRIMQLFGIANDRPGFPHDFLDGGGIQRPDFTGEIPPPMQGCPVGGVTSARKVVIDQGCSSGCFW